MFATAIEALHRRLDPGSLWPVAVAFSGGGDSLALLHVARYWAEQVRRPLIALTVDHGLHPDSAAWTAQAGGAAADLDVAWRSLAWSGEKPVTGLPAAARAVRHRLLAWAARDSGASVLLFGHTADDALESALMRAETPHLGRLREWSPSPAWPQGRGVFLLRPLLAERRGDVREWLAARGAAWLDDPANLDPRFARSRARDRLMAEGAAILPDAEPDDAALAELARACSITPDGRLLAPRPPLAEATPMAARRLLGAALLCASGGERPPRGRVLDRLMLRLRQHGGFTMAASGARVTAGPDAVALGREPGERARGKLQPLALCEGEPRVFDGRFALNAHAAGLTAVPAAGRMNRLSAADLAALRRLPAPARAGFPLLLDPAGEVSLPAPFGRGLGVAQALAAQRFRAACGLVTAEAGIGARL